VEICTGRYRVERRFVQITATTPIPRSSSASKDNEPPQTHSSFTPIAESDDGRP
jgi:hypothetical protein